MTQQQKINGSGLMRLKRAAICSCSGLRAAWKNEQAFRQEVVLSAVLLPCAFWFGDSGVEQALLIGSLLLVLIVELLNTAVEAVVDRISLSKHELSGLAKDLGSAAVSIVLLHGLIVWGLVLLS